MLQALAIADALAIAEASRRRSRDERAMVDYLGIGRKAPGVGEIPTQPLLRAGSVDLAAFESEERLRLQHMIDRLSPEARRELVALAFLGQHASFDFATAMRRTRRIPPPAQTGYLLGVRLERALPAALEKLGYRAA